MCHYLRPRLAAQLGGEAKVVGMSVGDQDAVEVRDGVTEGGEACVEGGTRARRARTGVDESEGLARGVGQVDGDRADGEGGRQLDGVQVFQSRCFVHAPLARPQACTTQPWAG
jgi:hypothetical protein